MKTSFAYLMLAALCALAFVASACESSGGKSSEQLKAETDASLKKQENKSAGIERLQRELSQVPAKEQLNKEPYRDSMGPYILERQGTGEYKFYVAPPEDLTTGELPPANELIVALIDYKKVDDGPYVIVEKNETIPGFRLDAEVTLIDHTIPAVIHRRTFKGEKPKSSLVSSNNIYVREGSKEVLGEKPLEHVYKWATALPLRK